MHPKLIKITIVEECESVSTLSSVLSSRFKHLSLAKYIENLCNLSKSILMRCPWVHEEPTIMYYRFHHSSQKSNVVKDRKKYSMCIEYQLSGAQLINHKWNVTMRHAWYLSGDNLTPYLVRRSNFLNFRTGKQHPRHRLFSLQLVLQ